MRRFKIGVANGNVEEMIAIRISPGTDLERQLAIERRQASTYCNNDETSWQYRSAEPQRSALQGQKIAVAPRQRDVSIPARSKFFSEFYAA